MRHSLSNRSMCGEKMNDDKERLLLGNDVSLHIENMEGRMEREHES